MQSSHMQHVWKGQDVRTSPLVVWCEALMHPITMQTTVSLGWWRVVLRFSSGKTIWLVVVLEPRNNVEYTSPCILWSEWLLRRSNISKQFRPRVSEASLNFLNMWLSSDCCCQGVNSVVDSERQKAKDLCCLFCFPSFCCLKKTVFINSF